MNMEVEEDCSTTHDGTVDWRGRPAIKQQSGRWVAANIILLNQGLIAIAFYGVAVDLVVFHRRVLNQSNVEAANSVSNWTGTVYIFSLVGAFLSDSYWGRYKTCAIFQAIFAIGVVSLSLSTYIFLIKPRGCGDEITTCGTHSNMQVALFNTFKYVIALGYGGYLPSIATFGADQFDDEDPTEKVSKKSFFGFLYLALNLGSLLSNTLLCYFEDEGMWALGFWASAGSALAALVLFLAGSNRYRHFKPSGNPLSRFCQVLVAAVKKFKAEMPSDGEDLFNVDGKDRSMNGARKILHSDEFKFLDRAAIVTDDDLDEQRQGSPNPWRLCPVTQIEEVKCLLRLIPIWLCTIVYSVVYTQMTSMFVEQGAAMKTIFKIPAASLSGFDILTVVLSIFLYRMVSSNRKTGSKRITELQRMGAGLLIAIIAMVSAGIVEGYRLKYAREDCKHCDGSSSLSIFWQVPQYALIGASEALMCVGQLEFFNAQTPDRLKSFGSAFCMTSISLGNYMSSLLVIVVTKITTEDHKPGWIPENLNKGHLDRFYFLLAILSAIDFGLYLICARSYKSIKLEGKCAEEEISEV